MDQGTEGLLSPWLRSRRLAAAVPLLRGRVLDVGCGAGALAQAVPPADYLGVEPDEASRRAAQHRWPLHRFVDEWPIDEPPFDTIALLAVIEHISAPAEWLQGLTASLASDGRLVLTTPHPAAERIHSLGSRIGLFSAHAAEEHESLLDRQALGRLAATAGLTVVGYRRFLGGLNQLCWMQRA
jgi:2-polyprenyl-3-methyl-5-hydroxy-6-metoxy-1,4-benzoquinol methylase